MAKNIRNILRKARVTGTELGTALVMTLIEANAGSESAESAPLFENEEIRGMVHKLSNTGEHYVYSQYVDLYQALASELNTTEAYVQQAWHGLYRLRAQACGVIIGQAAPQGIPAGLFDGIEALGASPPHQGEIQMSRGALLMPALRYLMHYNALLALLAKRFGIADITRLSKDLSPIQEGMDRLNEVLDALTASFRASALARDERLDSMMTLFRPASYLYLEPAPAARESVENALVSPTALRQTPLSTYIRALGTPEGSLS